MVPRSFAGNRLSLAIRAALLTAGLFTYLISPDDVVWRFIKTARHARALEHAAFGIAAAFLGFALLLKVRLSAHLENQSSHNPSLETAIVANLMQAIGIGSLLPLPGFLLLVVGDAAASLVAYKHPIPEGPVAERNSRQALRPSQAFRLSDALVMHSALCLAFLSMIVFSIVLIDRVADVLFGMTALVSIAANVRTFLRGNV